jgi:hypothetical protein
LRRGKLWERGSINLLLAAQIIPVTPVTRYEYILNDKQQNIGTNSTVTFSTVLCTVKVNNAQGEPMNNADVKYYAGAWRNIGLTSNGEVTKELLPANISFRASYEGVQQDKTQNITTNNIVEIILNTGQ